MKMVLYRNPDWKDWHISYTGSENRLELAAALGNDALTDPGLFAEPPPKEHKEFASVTKW